MASMRDIKRRKGSIQSTQQITKAMKLVSTVKLQRAKQNAEKTKTYFNCMYQTVTSILQRTGGLNNQYFKKEDSGKKAILVITSNRGLAGGYNTNITKLITRGELKDDELLIYAAGKKGKDTLARTYPIAKDYSDMVEDPVYAEARIISQDLLNAYTSGEVSEIYLAYTAFKNTVVHEPVLLKILPLNVEETPEESHESKAIMNFEPKDEEALNLIVPKYVSSLIYGGMVESVASENAARMQAMDSATSNAEEMIDKLTLLYNRARQGSITQELTEIIAGANAIN